MVPLSAHPKRLIGNEPSLELMISTVFTDFWNKSVSQREDFAIFVTASARLVLPKPGIYLFFEKGESRDRSYAPCLAKADCWPNRKMR